MYDLCSDLHIESNGTPDWNKLQKNDILIVAGDTSNLPSKTIKALFEAADHHRYEYIICTDGNHEHYGYTPIDETVRYFKEETKNTRIIYLDGEREFILNGVAFIGCNGWYDFSAYPWKYTTSSVIKRWEDQSNDADRIDFSHYRSPYRLAEIHSDYLVEKVVKLTNDPTIHTIIVTTHTVPDSSLLVIKGIDSWDGLSGAYSNSKMKRVIEADTNQKIKYWNYGHTHTREYRKIGHVTFINNCRGYAGEHSDFDLLSVK